MVIGQDDGRGVNGRILDVCSRQVVLKKERYQNRIQLVGV